MPTVEFVGQSGWDRDNIRANTSRLINCYREPTTGGKTVIKSVLGMYPHSKLTGVFVRAMEELWGVLYAACGGWVWTVAEDGTASKLFEIEDDEYTSISSNGSGIITVTAGGKYYLWDGTTLTQPTGGAFDNMLNVEFLNHYTLLTQRDGRQFQWSAVATPETLDGYYFTTADGTDDNIVRGMVISSQFWVFKEQSFEVWYNTGDDGADAFARVTGMVRNVGLAGYNMITRIPNGAFFVASDGRARVAGSMDTQVISTPPVDTAIKECSPVSCLTYEDEGHTFAAITFRDCPAWVMDIRTGEWHERAQCPNNGRWNVQASAKLGDTWYVGLNDGRISSLARSNCDGSDPLIREATSSTLSMDGARFIARELEFFPRQGISAGVVNLAVSRDGGMTWTPDKGRELGGVGNYGKRLIWRNLGQSRMLTARLRWSTPADVTFSTEARVVTQ